MQHSRDSFGNLYIGTRRQQQSAMKTWGSLCVDSLMDETALPMSLMTTTKTADFFRPFPKERPGQDPNTILTPMVKEIAAEKDWVDVKYTFQCSGEPWINANYWDKFWIWKMERALSLEPREGFVKLDGYIMKLPS